MKTSGHLIFYISENEDYELWRVLTQISPEERAAFIKNALKKALLQEDTRQGVSRPPLVRSHVGDTSLSELALDELSYSGIASTLEKDLHPFNYFSSPRPLEEINAQSGLNSTLRDEDEISILQLDELLKPLSNEVSASMKGLDFLLTNVIGEESDEEVIDFFRKKRDDVDDEDL